MEGIDYIIDERGDKKAIIISIDKFGDHLEDIEDILIAIDRKDEPRICLAEVEGKYIKMKKDV